MGPWKLRLSLLAALTVGLVLVSGSPPRLVGDGHEYMMQALNFARFTGPSIDHRVLPWMQRRLTAIEPRFASLDLENTLPAVKDGRRDPVHFWFYAALASPFVWLADETDVNPVHAFALLNLLLLGVALRLALPRMRAPACVLLFAGPIIWWIDKAHTEVFTFSLLTAAMVLLRDRPWWSMVALGAAATQNPPIAVALLLVAGAEVMGRRAALRDWRFWTGLAAGVGLAALHPAYFYFRYGQFSLLTSNLHIGIPSGAAFVATVLDPQIGLAGNFPGFLLVVVFGGALLVRIAPRDYLDRDITLAVAIGLFFMFSTAQAFNVHHGGTPGISRYAFWLVPLAVPLLIRAQLCRLAWWRRLYWATAILSAAISCWAFHPRVGENAYEPTLLADFMWNRTPAWSNPVPEVFSETILREDSSFLVVPVATRDCRKILVAGRGSGMPMWPLPCPPAVIPPRCAGPLALCYANLTSGRYEFEPSIAGYNPKLIRFQRTWPVDSETFVRKIFNELDWQTLDNTPSRPGVVRNVRQVDRIWTWIGRDRLLLVLDGTGAKASVTLRPELPMTGRLYDVMSQRSVQELDTQGVPGPDWEIPLPSHADTLLLTLRIR